MPGKISAMTSAMNDNPGIMLLVSNYIPVRNGTRINARVKNLGRNDGEIIPMRLRDYWLNNHRPGCTFCFRRELASMFEVMDIPGRLHDSMLWKYAIVRDSLYLMNRQLVIYRRQEGSTTNQFSRKTPGITQRLDDIDTEISMYQKFLEASVELGTTPENQRLIMKRLAFLGRRKKYLSGRNILMVAFFVMMNLKYYPTVRNALSDIYAVIFLKE